MFIFIRVVTHVDFVCPAFMPKIKTGRMVQLKSLCDFKDAEEFQDNTRYATTLYCKKLLSSDPPNSRIMFFPPNSRKVSLSSPKMIASILRNSSVLKSKTQRQESRLMSFNQATVRK